VVSVEEVEGRKALQRFLELPQALHGHDPRWAPPVMAWERYRLDPHRNPFFERGDAVYLLARLRGRPAGRVTAQVPQPGVAAGGFGFWWTVDDDAVAGALLAAAQAWLDSRGCREAIGPLSFTAADEPGVQVDGFEVPGVTGRPWHPPHLAARLEAAGAVPAGDQPTWRLDLATVPPEATVPGASPGEPEERDPGDPQEDPGQAGPYGDPRLALGPVAAVPDVADAMRSAGVRSAWSLARRARVGDWEGATVVRCDGEPASLVPPLAAAARAAGYRWLVAPWSPDPGARPEAVHRTYRFRW
jgi:hypothetical protein